MRTLNGESGGDPEACSDEHVRSAPLLRVGHGRVALPMDIASWPDTLCQIDALKMVPAESEIAVKSEQLPGDFHKDPAARIIVATARKFAAQWVSGDEMIRGYPHVRAIW